MIKYLYSNTCHYIISFLAGIFLALSFAPFNHTWLAIICPAILLYVWLDCSAKQAFLKGLCFGVGFFIADMYWIYISIYYFGHTSFIVALLLTAVFVTAMALFPATKGYVLNSIAPGPSWHKILLGFPILWICWEWLRTVVFTGLPWDLLGYSQTTTWLGAAAPYMSVYAVSFTVILLSSVLVILLSKQSRRVKIIALLLALLIIIICFSANTRYSVRIKSHVDVGIAQGNIAQSIKWNQQQAQQTLNNYDHLTQQIIMHNKLIIWPEAAIPLFANQIPGYLQALKKLFQQHHSTLITGILTTDANNYYYNSLIALGTSHGIYSKIHLVPFGEYFPLKPASSWLLQKLDIPLSDLTPGKTDQPLLHVGRLIIKPSICYEIIYPQLSWQSTDKSNLIVVISDDSWFDGSIAPAQHLQMAQMRARETGKAVVFATNSGITAVINPLGHIIKQLPQDIAATLQSSVAICPDNSWLLQWGLRPFIALLFLLAIAWIFCLL